MMKRLLFFFLAIWIMNFCMAQGVGIGTNTPNVNAALEINNPTKGLLIPRMDSVSRKNIPATNGLVVYDTSTKCFWYNDGSRWVNMPPKGNATGDVLYWNGIAWTVLPAGQGGQYLSLSPGTLQPVWSTVNTGGGGGNTSTQNISNIAPTTAVGGGSIVSDGGAAITARGIVWSTSPNPTIALSTKTNDGSGIGSFTSNLTGLTPAATYYVRAYATNINGTSYGNQVTFATLSSYTIGQVYGGGTIFYVDGTGQHGLVVAPDDLSTGISWRNNSDDIITNATGLAVGTGQANTNTIINIQGNGSYAATLCRDFYAGGGFTDWYLPSFYELNQLFLKKTQVGMTNGGIYWSSSEVSQYSAWAIDFSNTGPNQYDAGKYSTLTVRAIRKF